MSLKYQIQPYTYIDPLSQQEKTRYMKITLNAQGELTGEEQDYTGMSAEEWLNYKDYTSLRLLTLLDLETKLNQAGKSSPKVTATRNWINSIVMEYALNPENKLFWANPQYTFEETLQEALSILNS